MDSLDNAYRDLDGFNKQEEQLERASASEKKHHGIKFSESPKTLTNFDNNYGNLDDIKKKKLDKLALEIGIAMSLQLSSHERVGEEKRMLNDENESHEEAAV